MTRRVLATVAIIAVAALGLLSATSRLITDIWWFQDLGYASVFSTRIVWQGALFVVLFAVGFLFLGWNLWQTRTAIGRALGKFESLRESVKPRHVYTVMALGSTAYGLLFASGLVGHWWEIAQFVQAESFAITDPVFGKDIAFYFFTLPVLRLIVNALTGLTLSTLFVCGLIYFLSSGFHFASDSKRHLGLLAAFFLLILSGSHLLNIYGLLYSAEGVVYGAGYTDVTVRVWVLRLLAILGVLAAVGAILFSRTGRAQFLKYAVGGWIVASVVLSGIVPVLVQNWIVSPNEFDREREYLAHHIQMTRSAYGMDDFQEIEYSVDNLLDEQAIAQGTVTLQNARLWDPRPILPTYQQLQEMRPYYSFSDADVDRYMIDGDYRQVLLSARELDITRIQNRTWINQHLQYTHGYGLVMSPVNAVTRQRLPELWVYDIPPKSAVGIEINEPRLYFGETTNQYVIVNTKTDEFDYPLGDGNAFHRYAGSSGVYLSTLLHRLAFAMRFGESRILLSTDITNDSRVLFDRDLLTRVQKIAPFLRYDNDPYLVVDNGRLFWMIDAYTTSYNFPYAQPTMGWGNYIRNSVKVVIDAYNGTVDFYQVEPDPLLETFANVFPGLFKSFSEMPEGLRAHMRYPEDLLIIQGRMFGTYHMTDTRVFYNREDQWEFARENYGGREQEVAPYYVIMSLPNEPSEEMILMIPYIPVRRNNLIAWLGARNDGDHYGEVVVFKLPKDSLTLGPTQVEARIDQDPEISQLLTLWGQGGSQVIRGNLLVLPIANTILYVEPIYLQSEQSAMPQMQRVIVADQNELVIAEELDTALELLLGRNGLLDDSAFLETKPGRPGEPSDLVAEARFLYESANSALRAGDFAAFGEAWNALETVLQELNGE